MDYEISFDKENRNMIIIKKDGKLINYICCPPCKCGCDIISFGKKISIGYEYDFDGLVVITDETSRSIYYKGKLITKIERF